jgi:hypothetical protein
VLTGGHCSLRSILKQYPASPGVAIATFVLLRLISVWKLFAKAPGAGRSMTIRLKAGPGSDVNTIRRSLMQPAESVLYGRDLLYASRGYKFQKSMSKETPTDDDEACERIRWSAREPWVTKDPQHKREWLHPEPVRYYLHQRKDGLWSVCDRWFDLPAIDPARSRAAAIRNFYKAIGRPVPARTKLPKCP